MDTCLSFGQPYHTDTNVLVYELNPQKLNFHTQTMAALFHIYIYIYIYIYILYL